MFMEMRTILLRELPETSQVLRLAMSTDSVSFNWLLVVTSEDLLFGLKTLSLSSMKSSELLEQRELKRVDMFSTELL